ncbi:proteophosphoglycan 5 [Streptomyces lasiicapitis]|uniref:proteophosphoglycan 5 n=1 Tax=Streptomyces lasiicapitis TaxID=1923961 RepID=UPI0033253B07
MNDGREADAAMGLVDVDLPAPEELRGRWAAFAAISAAAGSSQGCHARERVWHFDDWGGNWLELHLVGDGRAVLIGHDHEYSDTYYGPAAEEFGEEETDLLAGAPDWWHPVVRRTLDAEQYVGFVYGYDTGGWKRAAYGIDDGFRSVGLPALSGERTHESIVECGRLAPGATGGTDAPREAIDALIAADGDVTEEQVLAVMGAIGVEGGIGKDDGDSGWDAAAGAAAAREFLVG